MIESLEDFRAMCRELWGRWRIDTPSTIPISASASVRITEDVMGNPSGYCGPALFGKTWDDVDISGIKVNSLTNHITRSLVTLHVVPDPVDPED